MMSPSGKEMRLFIAFELPPEIKKAVAGIQAELKKTKAHVSWVRPEAIHLTLKFLGEVPEAHVAKIGDVLREAVRGTGPVSVTLGGVGAFPAPSRPRVIWLGVHPWQNNRDHVPVENKMNRLRDRIEKRLEGLGFEVDKRPLSPHLTLGRVRSSRGRKELARSLEIPLQDPLGSCTFEELYLIRSELRPGGAVYSIIQTMSLN